MIVVDTSALMALLLDEPPADAIASILASDARVVIAGATLAEALIVAGRRGVRAALEALVDDLAFEVAPTTRGLAVAAADAYERWGKGLHPAALNFGDCLAYALATSLDSPLLYVGDDFARTDIRSAL